MPADIEKLKARLQKAEAARKKAVRQSQLLSAKLGKQERRDDTRRKVIDGAHMQTEAITNSHVAALLHRYREANLVRDDDRVLFGMTLLSDAEKAARGFLVETVKPRRSAKPKEDNVMPLANTAAAPFSDSIVDATPPAYQERRESEAA